MRRFWLAVIIVLMLAVPCYATFTFSSSSANPYVTLTGLSAGQQVSLYSSSGSLYSTGVSTGSSINLDGAIALYPSENSFEGCTGNDANPLVWSISNANYTGCTNVSPYSGTWSVYSNTGHYVYRTMSLLAGIRYDFYVYTKAPTSGESKLLISTSAGGGTSRCSALNSNTSWTLITCSYTPSTDETIYVNLMQTSGGGAYAYFDYFYYIQESITVGNHFWRVTDVDGSTFLDNSDWVTISDGDSYSWANSNLSKDKSAGMVLAGDNNADGDCTDSGEYGCYMKMQYNGSDYLFMGPKLGSNLALNKTVYKSSDSNDVCKVGPCLSFAKASTQYISVANEANFDFEYNTAFSFAGWIKTSDNVANKHIVAKNNGTTGYMWRVQGGSSAGWVNFYLYGVSGVLSVSSTVAVHDGVLHHVAVTKSTSSSGSGVNIYIDGALVGKSIVTDTLGTNSILNNQNLQIGVNNTTAAPFEGLMDNVAIFNTELTLSDVQTLCGWGGSSCAFPQDYSGTESGLVSAFNFNEGTGSIANDSKGVNNGTLINSPTWTIPTSFQANDGLPSLSWWTSTAVPQWVCIDLGSSVAFNRVHYIAKNDLNTQAGINSAKLQTSDTNCNTDMVDISGTSKTRLNTQPLQVWQFTSQTKRYVRLYIESIYNSASEVGEFEIYNEVTGNLPSDMDSILWQRSSDSLILQSISGYKGNTYTNNSDGSITISRTLSYGGTLSISTKYKQVSQNVWKKTITLNSSIDGAVQLRNSLTSYSTANCLNVSANSSFSCASYNYDTKPFQMSAISTGFPSLFGIVADNGCNANWALLDITPSSTYIDNTEVSGTSVSSFSQSSYVTYGKQYDGSIQLSLLAGVPKTFDVIIFRSTDPTAYSAQKLSTISLAEANGKTDYSEIDKLLWGTTYQLVRLPISTKQDYCYMNAGQFYTAAAGQYQNDSIWNSIGLGNASVIGKVIASWQRGTALAGAATLPWTDPLNQSPASFTNASKNVHWMAFILGYAVRRGIVTIQASCSNYETCVTTSARDELYTAVNNSIPSDGWLQYGLGSIDALHPNIMDANNIKDPQAFNQGFALTAYKSIEQAGSTVDSAKMTNLKNNYASLYNSTDGYVHFSKDGHWKSVSDAGASSGYYKEANGDYVGPATGIFFIPSGYSNATLQITYRKYNNYGKMIVKKTGVAVTESPIDLYAASSSFASTSITQTVSTGDYLTFQVSNQKNASSIGYKVSIDKITLNGATVYEETDAAWQCGGWASDCSNGYTLGWRRWKTPMALYGEYVMRALYSDPVLSDEQVRNHIGNMPSGNMGNGTLLEYIQTEDDKCIPGDYWNNIAVTPCKGFENGSTGFLFNASNLYMASYFMSDDPLWYRWDEKSDKFTLSGAWSNETDSNNFYQQYVWKSSTTNDYVEFKNVPFTDALVYMITGAGQGTATIYFDSGAGYDAGTLVDLSTASNPIYSKTGQTYIGNYKIKIKVTSGTIKIDYIKVKTKPSYLLEQRTKEEIKVKPWTSEYMTTDYYSPYYGQIDPIQGSEYYGFHIFYKGISLSKYPKWRMFYNGIYERRVN